MTPNSSSSGTTISSGNSSSLLRYPSLNGVGGIGNGSLDYLLNMQQQQQQQPPGTPSLSNYGLGIGGFGTSGLPPLHAPPPPTSPFMRYPNSLPSLGPGLGGFIFGNSDYERPRLYEEKNRPIRSPLLEEFRADKLKRWGVRVSCRRNRLVPSSTPFQEVYVLIAIVNTSYFRFPLTTGHARPYCRIHV